MALEQKKISELTEEQRLASLIALRGYKAYTVSLSQTGENAPTASIMEDTIGVSLNYIEDGIYTAQKNNGTFDSTKTFVQIQSLDYGGDPIVTALNITGTDIYIYVSAGGSYSNDCLVNVSFEIREYL